MTQKNEYWGAPISYVGLPSETPGAVTSDHYTGEVSRSVVLGKVLTFVAFGALLVYAFGGFWA